MNKLKLGAFVQDKPVKLSVELPGQVYRDLMDYAGAIARERAMDASLDPVRLIAPMLFQFMATDRVFARARKAFRKPLATEVHPSTVEQE